MIRNGNVERNYPSVDDGTATGVCRDHTIRYEFASKYTKGKSVIDAACGVGYGSVILQASDYVGYDVSDEAVNYGMTYYAKPGVTFRKKDLDTVMLDTLRADYRADVLVSFETIEHLKQPSAFLSWATFKADTIIVSTPIAFPGKHGLHSPYHTIEWYAEEFMELCQKTADAANEFIGDRGSHFKLSYFWEYDDSTPYIIDLDLKNPQKDGVIIAVFER